MEPEFKTTYHKLSQQVSGFATELLDQTRGSEELKIILNHDKELPTDSHNQDRTTLSQLKLAIRYKQKEVRKVCYGQPLIHVFVNLLAEGYTIYIECMTRNSANTLSLGLGLELGLELELGLGYWLSQISTPILINAGQAHHTESDVSPSSSTKTGTCTTLPLHR